MCNHGGLPLRCRCRMLFTRYDPEKHHRRSIRLGGYDYSQAGAYFVTVCTQNRQCLFGEIVDREMHLNNLGQIVQDEWFRTSIVRPDVELDASVVMPNHVHGIICVVDDGRGTARRAPTGSWDCDFDLGRGRLRRELSRTAPVPALKMGNHGGLPLRIWVNPNHWGD